MRTRSSARVSAKESYRLPPGRRFNLWRRTSLNLVFRTTYVQKELLLIVGLDVLHVKGSENQSIPAVRLRSRFLYNFKVGHTVEEIRKQASLG